MLEELTFVNVSIIKFYGFDLYKYFQGNRVCNTFSGYSRIALTRSFAFSRHKILLNFVEAFILDCLLCYIE